MECINIELFQCPKCERVLKPSTIDGVLTITNYVQKITKKVELHDILICRYCNIYIRINLLKKQKDPVKFLKEFKKIPENTEIKNEELHKIYLREQESDNLKKYKHSHPPDKCPECDSEDIIADSCDHGWICMSCDSYFQWEKYLVIFHGDCEVYAQDGEKAAEKGNERLRKGSVHIETDWM